MQDRLYGLCYPYIDYEMIAMMSAPINWLTPEVVNAIGWIGGICQNSKEHMQ